MTDLIRSLENYVQWPYSAAQLRADEPQLSLSYELPDHELATLSQVGVYVARVQPTDPPIVDPRTERTEETTPVLQGGVWLQQWTVRAATPEEIAAYDAANAPVPGYEAFNNDFLSSETYQTVFLPLIISPGYEVEGKVITLVSTALQNAMAGRVPMPDGTAPNALQSAIWILMEKLGHLLKPENLAELQTLFDRHGLGAFYSFFPPGFDPSQIVIPRWVEFGIALGTNEALNQWYYALFTPRTSILQGMITVGLGQAAQGNAATFLAAWRQAMAAGLIPPELAAGVVAAAKEYDLPEEFVKALAPKQ